MLLAVNFHYIRHSFEAPYPSIFGCTPQGFRNALEKLSLEGTFISGTDLVNAIDGVKALPEKALIITFDDGLKEQYELALPILDAMGIPALFFVNTQSVISPVVQNVHKIHLVRSQLSPQVLSEELDKSFALIFEQYDLLEMRKKAVNHYQYDTPEAALLKYKMNFILSGDQIEEVINRLFIMYIGQEQVIHESLYMTSLQIKDLGKRGCLGSHGHTHVPTGNMELSRKKEEAFRSQEILEAIVGEKVPGFSFPYGSESAATGMSEILGSAGYRFAFTMERAVNLHLAQPFALSRIDNNDAPGGKHFKGISGSFLSHLQVRNWLLSEIVS